MIHVVQGLFIPGRPRSKGSLRAVPMPGRPGKFRYEQEVRESKPWQTTITNAVIRAITTERNGRLALPDGLPTEAPCVVACLFVFDVELRADDMADYPVKRRYGDVDKLLRNAIDALTGVVYVDDQQVVDATAAKQFVGPAHESAGLWLDAWHL